MWGEPNSAVESEMEMSCLFSHKEDELTLLSTMGRAVFILLQSNVLWHLIDFIIVSTNGIELVTWCRNLGHKLMNTTQRYKEGSRVTIIIINKNNNK